LNIQNNINLLKIKNELSKKSSLINELINSAKKNRYNKISNNSQFDTITKMKYIQYQSYFCKNHDLFNNLIIEDKIKTVKINFNNINFEMFIYKKDDYLSEIIFKSGKWESKETQSILSSLFYYAKKRNITENDIYVLDIGANIGWYSLVLGKNGFNVISFEPSKINYYILLKNYCLNQDISMTIINRGLDIEEKNFTIYHPLTNLGDAIIFNNNSKINKTDYFEEDIKTTKLSNYIEYLKDKNLGLIKLDIEGSEANAIKGGIDLIIKYHIPFILMEFNANLLEKKGIEPKSFLELFENNGYKMNEDDFFSKKYISIDDLTKRILTNLYIVYTKFLE
jgi:FkbM family methyltransferase